MFKNTKKNIRNISTDNVIFFAILLSICVIYYNGSAFAGDSNCKTEIVVSDINNIKSGDSEFFEVKLSSYKNNLLLVRAEINGMQTDFIKTTLWRNIDEDFFHGQITASNKLEPGTTIHIVFYLDGEKCRIERDIEILESNSSEVTVNTNFSWEKVYKILLNFLNL